MDKKAIGAVASCTAALAAVLCAMSVALELPTPIEVALLICAVAMIVSAGALIGVALSTSKRPKR